MKFAGGAKVHLWDGTVVGRVDRLVFDPATRQVTHLVVHKGVLFTRDRVIPIDAISSSEPETVVLGPEITEDHLPEFEERMYVSLDERAKRDYETSFLETGVWVAPMTGAIPISTAAAAGEAATTEVRRNVPEGFEVVQTGAEVVDLDGNTIGQVESVATGPGTHLVVTTPNGRKLVPIAWVREFDEKRLSLACSAAMAERLPEPSAS